MAWSWCGSWFQTFGLAKENTRSSNLVDSLGFTYSVVSNECKPDHFVAERHVVTMSLMQDDVYIIHQYTEFVQNSCVDWQPIEFSQPLCYMVARSKLKDKSSRCVLYSLQQRCCRRQKHYSITEVDSLYDQCQNNSYSDFLSSSSTDLPQPPQMVETGSGNGVYLLLHTEFIVEMKPKILNTAHRLDNF